MNARNTAGGALLLVNARIRTMDPAHPQAEALLVRHGRIAAIGARARVERLAPPDVKVIDAGGRLCLPGFQDAHVHLLSGGVDLATAAPLYDCRTLDDLLARLARHGARHAGLPAILGSGWQPGTFGEHNLSAAAIDPATPGRPAAIQDSSGHSACLNSLALAMAGIGDTTPDPPNGLIVRDAAGRPTGMLHEDAVPWALERLPQPDDDQLMQGLMAGQAHANAHGLTGVLDPKVTDVEARIYARAAAGGRLTLRVAGAAWVRESDSPDSALARLAALRRAHPGPDFHVHSAKFFMDGVFENRTAALCAPYADAAGGNAAPMFDEAATAALFAALDAARFQIHVHVIGDAALARALDGLAAARAANGVWPALHQLTHLQLAMPADIQRMAGLGAMANIQPLWARLDPDVPDIALAMIGPARLGQTYAFRQMLDAGCGICLSSDWPVTTLDPFAIIETAVTRQAPAAERPRAPFLPQEALTVEECVQGYTAGAAAACWRGDLTGRLLPGFSADLIVLDRDIFACPPARISQTRVLLTLFRGAEVHRAPEFAG